jgi:thiol-disulfide isomerase/thioredoxin
MKDVTEQYGGRVEFVSVNWGESKLAERYGVKRYPVVFVDDVLVAQPDDFGWYGAKGKYTPWKEKASHERFKRDLTRMIDLVLGGQKEIVREENAGALKGAEITELPGFNVTDLAGQQVEASKLKGRVVIVEFWATWCPPCLSTLSHLGEVKRRRGDAVGVIAIAVESKEPDVRELTAKLDGQINFVMGTEALAAPFGTLGNVPRMFVFDRQGRTAGVYYGATPDLHEKLERLLDSLSK